MSWLKLGLALATNLTLINLILPLAIAHEYKSPSSINLSSQEYFTIESSDDDYHVTDLIHFNEETFRSDNILSFNLTKDQSKDPSMSEHGNTFLDVISIGKEMFHNFNFTTKYSTQTHESSNPDDETQLNETSSNTNFTSKYDNRPVWHKTLEKVLTYVMTFNVVGIMFGMGCAIYWKEIIQHLWPPIGIIIGMIGQFIVLPATGFGFSILFKLKPYEALGCLVVSCSPGGSFSNFFTYWVDGDLALSIVMTSCSSIIAFVGMPFNLWLYSSYYVGRESSNIVIPYLSIMKSLGFICGPVILGMIIRHFSEKAANVITRVMSVMGYLGFVTALTGWIILYWQIFIKATSLVYGCAITLPITGFTLAYIVALICRRPHKVCRTIGIETGSQNMPVAMSIILLSFSDPEIRANMLLFPTLYGAFMFSEFFIGVGLYSVMKWCWTKKEQEQYPVTQKAIMVTGVAEEKYKVCCH